MTILIEKSASKVFILQVNRMIPSISPAVLETREIAWNVVESS